MEHCDTPADATLTWAKGLHPQADSVEIRSWGLDLTNQSPLDLGLSVQHLDAPKTTKFFGIDRGRFDR